MDSEARSPGSAPPAPRGTLPAALGVAALAAVLAAAFLWHELDQARDAVRERERTVFENAERERVALRAELEAIGRITAELTEREAALEREVARFTAAGEAGREALALADAAHLLRLAEETLHLVRDPTRAAVALRAADARLVGLRDPRALAARAQLARDAAALEALPKVDVPALTVALGTLAGHVAALPLRTRIKAEIAPPPAPDAELDGLGPWPLFVAKVEQAFGAVVHLRRVEGQAQPLLSAEQEWFLRRNLELKLESARLAALARDGASFRASTRDARDWLAVHFDPESPAVKRAVLDLDAMQRAAIDPPLPDVSRTRALLEQRAAPAR